MAIKLNRTDEKGVITRYHRISEFTVFRGTIHATVESFVNDKIRKNSDNSDLAYSKKIFLLDYNGEDKLCFACVYEKLLQTDEFHGGEKI